MLLNEAGYYSFQDNKFHFCLKDHQGNVRVVTDEAGNVDEVNDYYPFGGLMSNGVITFSHISIMVRVGSERWIGLV